MPDWLLVEFRVKFGAFFEYLEGLQGEGFDRIASGHYARLVRDSQADGPVSLALSPDAVKDQTYFLSHLSQSQLARLIFPLGELTKVRKPEILTGAFTGNPLGVQ
jgi:tRNA-5-taurinomethyluridine 2-sulfurtransferase